MSIEGQRIGRYQILNLLGRGNMGEVYLAEDTELHRQVAIKVILSEVHSYPDPNASGDANRLFEREARVVATLDHSYILPLFDYGKANLNGSEFTYMVMPYRKEGSFAGWLRQRSGSTLLPPRDVVHFMRQAATALQHAHNNHITHQDVKPSNFLIRSNADTTELPDLLLADFGIARFDQATVNRSQVIRGTPSYMAPEQWSGKPVPASDQYALAIMAYELLTGRSPFQGGLEQMMYQHLQVEAQPPSRYNPALSHDVDSVFRVAFAKRPEERFASVSAFARALEAALLDTSANDQLTIGRMAPPPPVSMDSPMHTTLAISMGEAATGTRRTLTLPDGRQIFVDIPAGTTNGQLIRVDAKGFGSTYSDSQNTLLLTVIILPPEEPKQFAIADNAAPTIVKTPTRPEAVTPVPVVTRPQISRTMIILLVILAASIAFGGSGILYFFLSRPQTNTANLSQTTSGTVTSTVSVTTTAAPTVTLSPTSGLTPTPTVDTQATATAQASQNPYTHSGILLLDDPLADNSRGYNWQTGTNSRNASCAFQGGAYHVTQPAQGFFHSCTAYNTNFSNFAFEVQMTLLSGDYSGIIFCQSTANQTYYLFRVGPDNSYLLYRNMDAAGDQTTLASGSVTFTRTSIIGVVVTGGRIDLYLNRQLITTVYDSSYTSGQIALFTWNDTHAAETVFTNAKVWSV